MSTAATDAGSTDTQPATPNKRRRKSAFNLSEGGGAPFLVAPTLALLAIVIGYPVLRAVWMSFQKDPGLDKATGLFVSGGFAGISNYTHWILERCSLTTGGTGKCPAGSLGAEFWTAMGNTVLFTVISVSIEIVLGMWFAMIMNRKLRGRGLLRAAILIPWAIPTAVTAKLFFFIFAFNGIANKLLHTHILWTGDAWPARFAVIGADVWKTTPFMALLILAGLQVIPEDVYEAARVDGATTLQRFTQITLPLVKPALMVAILFRTLDVLRIFDLPFILTGGGGGKGDATTTLSILVIQQIRQGFNSAAALSTITFLFIFAVAFFFVKFLGANVVQTQSEQQKAGR
jgi:multiple sugar transport system permease protein